MILASWRGDRHSTVAFGRNEQLGATVLGRFLNPLREVIRKTPAEPHAVSVQYRVEVAGLRDAGTECVGLPANIETIINGSREGMSSNSTVAEPGITTTNRP